MIKVNGKWFHDALLEVGSVYMIRNTDSMSLDPGDKYTIDSCDPATVRLPNFGNTAGAFITMHKSTSAEIAAWNKAVNQRAIDASGDPR